MAFDAGAVTGAVASWGLLGLRLHAAVRVPLSTGALVPSPVDSNLARPEEVRDALRSVRAGLGANGRRAVLVLPDGLARMVLVRAPRGVPPNQFARFRVAQGLPYAAEEAITAALPVSRDGALLAAAVRRSVVRSYEEAVAAAGFAQDRLDLAPLAALSGLLPETRGRDGIAVILGDAALSLAVFGAGAVRTFRCRRRDQSPGEAERLRDEIERTATLSALRSVPHVKVVGPGSRALVPQLMALGLPAEAGWRVGGTEPPGAAEMGCLGAARA